MFKKLFDGYTKPEIISLLFFSVLSVSIHIFSLAMVNYGIFRDELYYLACASKPAAGYVDHPPFSIWILTIWTFVFGDSIISIRILPIIASCITLLITSKITKKLNGSPEALVLSLAAVTFMPIFWAMTGFYSMNFWEYIFIPLLFLKSYDLLEHKTLSDFVVFGLIAGLAFLNKVGITWFIAGFLLALLITGQFKILLSKKFILLALIFTLLSSIYFIWNIYYGFPHLEFMGNALKIKYAGVSRIELITGSFVLNNIFNAVLWVPVLFLTIFRYKTHQNRKIIFTGVIFLTVLAILLINGNAKPEYLSPYFIPLFSAGAVLFSKLKETLKNYVVNAYYIFASLFFVVVLPIVLPVLPQYALITYGQTLKLFPPNAEGHQIDELPQFYADMHGWEEMAQNISDVYKNLSTEEKSKTIFFGTNYGQASAIMYYSKKYELPKVVAGHNNFFLWGFTEFTPEIVIQLSSDRYVSDLNDNFNSVVKAGFHTAKYAMPYENNLNIYILRQPKEPILKLFEKTKSFI